METLEITPTHLVVPFVRDNGEEVQVWTPQPHELELKQISRILSYLATQSKDGNLNCLIIDWERYVEEALDPVSANLQKQNKEALIKFLDRQLSGAQLSEGDINELSSGEVNIFKGTLLFICALLRYTSRAEQKGVLNPFTTSLNATEWKTHLSKLQKEAQPRNITLTISTEEDSANQS